MSKKIHPVKSDCAFLNKRRSDCNILCETLCVTTGKCSFYKTEEQRKKDLKKYPNMEDYKKRRFQ